MKIKTLTFVALMSALMCILGPLSLPIGPVPISLTNLVIYFTMYILDTKKGALSYLIYLLIGFAGVPVFSGFSSGPAKLLGPTGGYLIGFFFMALITGLFVSRFSNNKALCITGMVLATLVTYAFGTAWLAYSAKMTFIAALAAGVIPFIPGDLIKIVIAAFVGPILKKRLRKAK